MKRTRKFFYVLGFSAASWLAAIPASAQTSPRDQGQQPAPKDQQAPKREKTEAMGEKMSMTATVEKVDAQKRHLTLKDDQGKEITVDVPESVKRLDEVKVGDRIKIDYYEAVGISLKKPEPGAQPSASDTTVIERNAGKLPSGMMARRITATVEVMKVDAANNKLTVKRPGGEVDTINITDPAERAMLGNIKEGDRIQATFTEAAAITVTREGKEAKGQGGKMQEPQENK